MGSYPEYGSRVECDKTKGILKWIGEIPGTSGIWFGIDWDEEKRGKHDGSHQGIHYFHTRYSTSGSFIRPAKLNFGVTLEEAIRAKYQDDFEIEEVLTSQLKRNIKASFVEVVGMEKIGKQQSDLQNLQTIILDGWLVKNGGDSDLRKLLPRLRDLEVSNSLLSNWRDISQITQQLPNLRLLNISGNVLELPENVIELSDSLKHVTHLIMNRISVYSWEDLLMCAQAFPALTKIQLAFNNLATLGPVLPGQFEHLKDIDLGVSPIEDWTEICHLGMLPKLEVMNLNNCKLKSVKFPETRPGEKTPLFANLRSLMAAKNPLAMWESVGELDKLVALDELILSNEAVDGRGNCFLEFTFARIRNLMTLNRTTVNLHEKRDYQLFYLRSFSDEYYSSGGTENPNDAVLTPEFIEQHPTYSFIVKICGTPMDERNHRSRKSQKLRDLKIELLLQPKSDQHPEIAKSFLPSTKISKMKMMIRRIFNLGIGLKISLFYCPAQREDNFEIELDNDMKDLEFYSVEPGDSIKIRW